jgi:hypothetical protein
MEKTTVYLTAEQKAALARVAAVEGRSEARLIRAGIDVVTARHRAAEASTLAYGATPAGAPGAPIEGPATAGRPRWLPREEFVRAILRRPADAALRAEIRALAPDRTDAAPLE